MKCNRAADVSEFRRRRTRRFRLRQFSALLQRAKKGYVGTRLRRLRRARHLLRTRILQRPAVIPQTLMRVNIRGLDESVFPGGYLPLPQVFRQGRCGSFIVETSERVPDLLEESPVGSQLFTE